MPIRVLVAEKDSKKRENLREIIASCHAGCEVVGLARDGHEAMQMTLQLLPDIVFGAYDLPGISGLQTCEMLNALAPDIMFVLVVDNKSPERVEAAMRAGARAVVCMPLQPREIEYLIDDLAEIAKRRCSSEVLEWKDPSRFPKVISVTAAKGGVGKTTIAVNLAVTLARQHPKKVAVVDLYTQFGDVATMFNVRPNHTLAELAPQLSEIDQELIKNYVSEHSSGVHILVASTEPLPLDFITVEHLDSLLSVLKRIYRYVIIDLPPMLHPTSLHVLSYSNIVLLVANLFDLTTATDTKKYYDALGNEHIAKEKVKIILNRVSKVNRIQTADIEAMFDCEILAHVPNDGRLVSAVNQGIPLVMTDGDSAYGRSMERLAGAISGIFVQRPVTPEKTEKGKLLKGRR